MFTIDSELLAFESKLSNELENLESAYNELTANLSTINSVFSNDFSSLPTGFSGGSASVSIRNEMAQLEEKYNKVKVEMEKELKSLIDRVSALIAKIGELKVKQAAAISAYNHYCWACSLSAEQIAELGVSISAALSEKNRTYNEFLNLQASLKSELASLRGVDIEMPNLSSVDITSLDDITIIGRELNTIQFEYGGKTYEYLLYVPQTAEKVDLPMVTFLPGFGERGKALTNTALPKDITGGEDYPAIVLMPVCPTYTRIQSDEMIEVVDAMTEEVINNYNVDESCIGITGHSDGAVATYGLVAKNPERYSYAAPVSGLITTENTDSWTKSIASGDTMFHIVHGEWDGTCSYWSGKGTADRLTAAGVNVEFESLPADHGIGNLVYIENDLVHNMLDDMYTIKQENQQELSNSLYEENENTM